MLGVCDFLFVPSQTGPGFECHWCVIFYYFLHRLVLGLNAVGVSFFICSVTFFLLCYPREALVGPILTRVCIVIMLI